VIASESTTALTAKRTASLIKHRMLDLYLLVGRVEGESLRVLVADDGTTLPYVKSLCFRCEPEVISAGRIAASAADGLHDSDADIVVVGANCLRAGSFSRQGFHLVPKWVRLFLPTTEEPYARLYEFGRQTRKYFKWMLKKARDEQFECEFVHDPAWVSWFYDEIYSPYAKLKFGDQAIIHSPSKLQRAFSQGWGAVVKKDGVPAAGAIISTSDRTLRIGHYGAAGDGYEANQNGAAFALDYHIVEWAHKNGYEYVDFGHSRPFLSDGVLRYKRNWHMEVRDDDDALSLMAVAAPGQTAAARKFLADNPFYELVNGIPTICEEYSGVDYAAA
jgi:hypothetical protein